VNGLGFFANLPHKTGVGVFINVGIDVKTNALALALAEKEQDVYATVGLHPHSAHEVNDDMMKTLETQLKSKKVVAMGEMGLDYYKSEADPKTQKKVFKTLVRMAKMAKLPMIVHSRNAFEDTLSILKEERESAPDMRVVFHCFSYGEPEMREVVRYGFRVSFTGIATFKGADEVRLSAAEAPLNHMMIETDSPYLAPQPVRGKRNEPAYLRYVCEEIARLKNMPSKVLEVATTKTALHFFNLNEVSTIQT